MICRICDATQLDLAVDLGLQPWCNHFLKKDEIGHEPFYPLRVVYCHQCGTSQLDFTVRKEVMFGDHTYLSGVTKSLDEHFNKIATDIDERFFRNVADKSVLDIGSNDGTQLKHFQRLGYKVLGVESSKTTARIAQESGIETLNAFFNLETARSLGVQYHVINAAGVFFHLEELHSVTEGIRESLREDGVFVVQFLYMKSIVDNLAFDQIYHEHLLYYNLRPLGKLLERHGLMIFDAKQVSIHGGSIIAFVSHKRRGLAASDRLKDLLAAEHRDGSNCFETYLKFAERIKQFRRENIDYLFSAKAAGKKVWGFGAPVKGNTLLNYFGIRPDSVEYLVERNELRRGLYAPGSHIPILIERELTSLPDIYYVLAWNFKKEILQRNQLLIDRGIQFFFPINPPEF